jgi:3-hydroxyisobutyrate dehydrogenase-like beta-hydroxyacid dehydrogenase
MAVNDCHVAPTFKLIGNSLILGSLEIMAEAFTMAEKSDIGADAVQDLLKGLYTFFYVFSNMNNFSF